VVDGWSVDPSGVEAVLNDVVAKSGAFSQAVGGTPTRPAVDAIVLGAATAAESPVIGASISGFFEENADVLTGITNRISACLAGAAGAVTAIDAGDGEMAATTQANAVAAADGGDLSLLSSPQGG
jgi:hypothetical protein